MSTKEFFTSDNYKNLLTDLLFSYHQGNVDFPGAGNLKRVLDSMARDGESWDKFCQYTIKKHGDAFQNAVMNFLNARGVESFELVRALTLPFVIELELSTSDPLPEGPRDFKDEAIHDLREREDRIGVAVRLALQQLPISILKNILNSAEIGSLKNLDNVASEVAGRIREWQEELDAKQKKVDQLKAALEEQQHAFNFVGLYKGFAQMEETVSGEMSNQRKKLHWFGALVLSPALLNVALVSTGYLQISTMTSSSVFSWVALSLTCTAIMIYFFRIILREVDSKDAQLMQIRLRMTLCQFVQNYANFATGMKKDNPETLSKFENLIFSGIVGTQDKLPSTFDGLEHLGNLMKTVRGG